MLSACALHALARDLEVDRIEGCLLLGAMVAFTAWMVRAARRDAGLIDAMEVAPVPGLPPSAHGARAWLGNLGAVALGLGLLVGGSSLLVHGAVAIAEGLGVSDTVIGLSVVAAGTSLPELAASVVASLRGKDDMAVANVLGSNIFNSLAIIGTSSLVRPLTVPERVIRSDDWWMLGATALLLPVMRSGMRIGRLEGALLVACFISYMVWLVRGA
jgi:cation:H+ antiporter